MVPRILPNCSSALSCHDRSHKGTLLKKHEATSGVKYELDKRNLDRKINFTDICRVFGTPPPSKRIS